MFLKSKTVCVTKCVRMSVTLSFLASNSEMLICTENLRKYNIFVYIFIASFMYCFCTVSLLFLYCFFTVSLLFLCCFFAVSLLFICCFFAVSLLFLHCFFTVSCCLFYLSYCTSAIFIDRLSVSLISLRPSL